MFCKLHTKLLLSGVKIFSLATISFVEFRFSLVLSYLFALFFVYFIAPLPQIFKPIHNIWSYQVPCDNTLSQPPPPPQSS